MRHALILLALLTFAVAACDSSGSDDEADPSPTVALSTCPSDEPAVCDVAAAIETAMQTGEFGPVVANTRVSTAVCAGNEQLGPCAGLAAGTELSGYVVGLDASEAIAYEIEEAYVEFLRLIREGADPAATDEYGEGAWRIAALIDEGPDRKTLVTTSIGTDPIYDVANTFRRLFLFRLERVGGDWQIASLLASVQFEPNLTGVAPDSSQVPGWVAWGEA